MDFVATGDRAQIRCSSQLEDGTQLEDAALREAAYWIRANDTSSAMTANHAVIGMVVGERKQVSCERASGKVLLTFELVDIRRSGASKSTV